MNWFTNIKLAFPILQKGYDYTEVGHTHGQNPYVKEWLWLIDKNWNLHVEKIPKIDPRDPEAILDLPVHEDVWPNDIYDPDTIAAGRVEEDTRNGRRNASLRILKDISMRDMFLKEKLEEKVSRLLDRAFKNPEISTY